MIKIIKNIDDCFKIINIKHDGWWNIMVNKQEHLNTIL